MTLTQDVYPIVGKTLQKKGFYKREPEQQKTMVDNELKKYLISKISMISGEILSETLTTPEVFNYLASLISREKHFEELRHIIHFLLNISGEMQGWTITWWSETDKELIEKPLLKFDKNEKWTDLITTEDTKSETIFQSVHNAFIEKVIVPENPIKQIKLRMSEIKPKID